MLTSKSANASSGNTKNSIDLQGFYIGLALAILSSFIMAWSYIVKKLSLNRLVVSGRRAGDGGYGYLKDWMWWLGLVLMAGGEIINSVAYGFAPASLVTPLGALSVLFTAAFSARILHEHLNLIGKIGCAISLGGSTVIVIHAPKEQLVTSIQEFTDRFISYGFIIYMVVTLLMVIVLLWFLAPRYGKKNPMIYILVSSSVGSISVMAVKGIGVFVKELIAGKFIWSYWITYVTLIILLGGLLIQVNYLNKALDLFNANIVTPLIYVCFTVCVIVASSILFEEWSSLTLEDCLGIIDGFFLVILGFLLLYLFKDMHVTWRQTKSDFFDSLYKDGPSSLPGSPSPVEQLHNSVVQAGDCVHYLDQSKSANMFEAHDPDDDFITDDNVPFLANGPRSC